MRRLDKERKPNRDQARNTQPSNSSFNELDGFDWQHASRILNTSERNIS
jgi:hypothetical protein